MPPPDDDPPPPAAPEWVVTYGDMMSLLLTFFIMLVSMSRLKEEGQIRTMMDSIREAFGSADDIAAVPGNSPQSTSLLSQRSSLGMRAEGSVRHASRDSRGPGGAHRPVDRINHGTVVTLGGPAQFARFDATLNDDLKASLTAIARVVADRPNRLIVRGHASPEPLPPDLNLVVNGLQVRDAWDLSFARANSVANYLVAQGIDRRRLVVSAAGDTEPRTRTRDLDGQRLNRRVDVFVIDEYITPR